MGKTMHSNCKFRSLYNIFPKDEYSTLSLKKLLMLLLIVSEKHPKVRTFMKSYAMLFKEQRRHVSSKQFFVIHPLSLFRMAWETLIMLCQFCVLIYEPYLIAFYDSITWKTFSGWYVVIESLCFFDTMLNFVSGYIDKQNVIMDLRTIIPHYLLRGFMFDLLATFPWDVPLLIYKENIKTKHLQSLRIISVLCLYRLICLGRYVYNTWSLFRIPQFVVATITFSTVTLVCWAWTAMAQIYIPCTVIQDFSYRAPTIGYGSKTSQILNCIFQGSMLFFSIALGSLEALTWDEMLRDFFCLFVGVIWLIVAVNFMIHSIFRWDTSSARYDVMTKQLGAYMSSKRLPPDLQRRILLYYEHRTQKMFFKEQKLLENLTVRLRTELLMHRTERLMSKIELFNKLPRTVIAKLAPFLRRELYLPNDVIIKAGSLDNEMYFLATGCVAIYTRWGEEVRHLEDGSFFGEIAMLLKDERRTTSVAAVNACEVFTLHRDDFLRVLRPFRELYRGIEVIARQRLGGLMEKEAERRRARSRSSSSDIEPGTIPDTATRSGAGTTGYDADDVLEVDDDL